MSTVVLVSGGLDSTVAADFYPDADLVFVDYGQPYRQAELKAVSVLFLDRRLEIVTVGGLPQLGSIFMPGRNLLLATVAAQLGDEIVMAGLKDDHVVDKTPQAFLAMSRILSDQSNTEKQVVSPFWHLSKMDLVSEYLQRFSDGANRLVKTHSCYSGADSPCLRCPACFRWSVALRANGCDVPMPDKSIIQAYLSNLHTYENCRIWSTLKAIKTNETPVVVVDIDGVLTVDTNGHNYVDRRPRFDQIYRLRQQFESGWVVLHSSRRECDRQVTEKWLKEHRAPYHALLLEKPPASLYVDDLSVSQFSC